MARTSRLPGFYKITVEERRALVSEVTGIDTAEMAEALDGGGPWHTLGDKLLKPCAPHAHQCELGGDKKTIPEDQSYDSHEPD